jgi:hypothetical protein
MKQHKTIPISVFFFFLQIDEAFKKKLTHDSRWEKSRQVDIQSQEICLTFHKLIWIHWYVFKKPTWVHVFNSRRIGYLSDLKWHLVHWVKSIHVYKHEIKLVGFIKLKIFICNFIYNDHFIWNVLTLLFNKTLACY